MSETLRFRVLWALALAAAIAYLCRHPLGVAESTISAELGLSPLESGVLMGTFFWTSAGSFFTFLGSPSATAIPIDIGGKQVAKIFAVMNMTGNFAAAACPVLVGWIFSTTNNWNMVLLLFAGLYLAAASCWLAIDPTVDVTQANTKLRRDSDTEDRR